MRKSPAWYKYQQIGGIHMPAMTIGLCLQGSTTVVHRHFLVDTGAAMTFAPLSYAVGLLKLEDATAQPTPCKDASGKTLKGIPVTLQLHIPALGQIEETVYFANIAHGLLGQSSFLQQVEGYFFNALSDSRRFGLYLKK